ncbi:MAG TPA: prepilin-type N-terminal cleavage/methylation domain-containing protein [Gemmatimonadaceae bacterium]|nr:prepilin-type N-terminal cleavage/methylation domain-containing protein [Gemmatimonadaceae bacterium]
MLARRGTTLVELIVAMTLAAIILSAATGTFVRQRRAASDHASRVGAEAQLRAALGELQVALAGVSASAGDLAPGEARDTAIQLRSLVGSAVACDSGAGQATVAANDTSATRASAFAANPRVGDTLWWRVSGASSWAARRVAVITTSVGACPAAGADPQPLLRLTFTSADTVPRGVPLRVTRQERFSFYHAADGSWQLGISEWSDVLHAFAPPQPVAGPFRLVAPGARTGMRYFDASGAELSMGAPGVTVSSVARVRVAVVAPWLRSDGTPGPYRRDSLDLALSHGP